MKGSQVSIDHVSKRFGDFIALSDINFVIKAGEFFSLLGPSGCGKTTLLRIIAGFEKPDDGVVLFDDTNVIPFSPDKRHSNTVFQTYALFPHLSVYDNIAFPLRLKKVPKAEIDEKVKKYVHLVQLDEHISKKPNQLSGGQKQRVAIARALINEPKVLLLDEPLSALDAKLRANLLIDLDNLHDKIGITFIYVTHDQSEALSVSDRIAVMNHGHVLQVGTPFEIYESPATQFVAEFIGETNLFEAEVEQCIPYKSPKNSQEEYMVTLKVPALGKQVCQRDDDGDLTEFGRLQTALTQVTGAGAPLEEGGHTAAAGFHRKHGEQNEDVRPVDQVGVAAEQVVVEEDHSAHGDDTGQHPEKLKARVGDGVGVERLRQPVHLFLRRPCGSGVDGNNAKQRYADYEQEQRPVKMPDQSGIEPVFLNVRAQLFYPFLHEASFPNPVRSLCVRRSCGIL